MPQLSAANREGSAAFSFDLLFQQEQLTYVSKPLYNHTTKLS